MSLTTGVAIALGARDKGVGFRLISRLSSKVCTRAMNGTGKGQVRLEAL